MGIETKGHLIQSGGWEPRKLLRIHKKWFSYQLAHGNPNSAMVLNLSFSVSEMDIGERKGGLLNLWVPCQL